MPTAPTRQRFEPRFGDWLVTLLLLLAAFPAAGQNQFIFDFTNRQMRITGYTCASNGPVTIPNKIGGLPVTSIGDAAFSGCMKLTGITIPDSVISIGHGAFAGCFNLKSVIVPDGVTNIGPYAFFQCYSLKSFRVPSYVTVISGGLFRECGLNSITIPPSVLSIEDYAFFDCIFLTNIVVPNSVTNLGYLTFASCNILNRIVIGRNILHIDPTAFNDLHKLEAVYFMGNAPSWDPYFRSNAEKVIVYYLPGTTGWDSTFSGRPTTQWYPALPLLEPDPANRLNPVKFRINGSDGLRIVVETSENLANPTWSPILTNTLAGGFHHFTDPVWRTNQERFYRVRSQ